MSVEDQQLIEQFLQGDADAFDQLILRYQDRLFNTLLRMFNSEQDAQDAVQEAFVQVFQKLHTFQGKSQFYSWLCRIAINNVLTQKRKRKLATTSLETAKEKAGIEPDDHNRESHPSHQLETSENQSAIQRALNELADDQRTVIVLKEIEGLKYEEIAEIIDCPVGTVRSRIHRARSELRQKLQFLWDDNLQQ
ncbi:ECF RNA polymerase sigma-E factor [Polystyrenella longa]|uniref:ECF RNA polymerase sigma-E factor n=1 Tax=Polystyrenella longa TaxID=2528007 RepID=A0A518CJZ3_9PLAN|nr:sigma-70 family RNA polymerase sigma factor [Polystyrenella longa]QDU79542.1 ECF RNA polymerase sigma-E factor [Polystyrenella longa]